MEQGDLGMSGLRAQNRTLGSVIPAGASLAFVTLALAIPQSFASAHQTQISDGVGGTHHIEPNDTPRAGEPSQTWFALTQAGGTAIGLSDCDCELVLADGAGETIATPALSAIAVEGLTDVPAAELTFPQVGAYVLTLMGGPKGSADFPEFRLDFPVTVAAGQAITEQAVPEGEASGDSAAAQAIQPSDVVQRTEPEEAASKGLPLIAIGFLGACAAIAGAWVWQAQQR